MPGFISAIRVRGRRAAAFTLAELLIGVTISAFVMTAVAVFMGSGVENAFRIKKSLERGDSGVFFDDTLADLQNFGGTLIHSGALTAPYGTGILLKNTDAATPLTLLSIRSSTGICDAFSGTVDDPGAKDFLILSKYFLPAAAQDDAPFTLDHTGHVVRSGGAVVLGTGNEGDLGGNGTSATSTELRFPGAVVAHGAGFFAADTGNDRVLFVSGGTASTLLGPKNGIRFPRSLNVVGGALLVAEGGRILRVEDSLETGTAFSASTTATGAFSFDSAEVSSVPGSAGIFQSSTGAYVFAGLSPTSVVSTVGNTGTLSFPSTSVTMGDPLAFSIALLTQPASPGGYGMRIILKNAGSPTFDQTFRYFTKGDADLATMTGNVVSVVSEGLSFPYGITSGGAYQNGISNFSAFVAAAPAAETFESDRIVEDFKVSAAGGVLTLSYVEYVRYDCVGGRHTKRERVLKIPLR